MSNGNPGCSARLYAAGAGPRARPPRVGKGDVKACYVRIWRRWVRVGTLCLDCAEFVSELPQPPGYHGAAKALTTLKEFEGRQTIMFDDGHNRPGVNRNAAIETVFDSIDPFSERAAGKAAEDIQSDGTPAERLPRNPDCFQAEYLGDTVWFVLDEGYLDRLPAGAIAYTLAEARC